MHVHMYVCVEAEDNLEYWVFFVSLHLVFESESLAGIWRLSRLG